MKRKPTVKDVRATISALLTRGLADRRTGGLHRSRRNELPRKAKHKGRIEE